MFVSNRSLTSVGAKYSLVFCPLNPFRYLLRTVSRFRGLRTSGSAPTRVAGDRTRHPPYSAKGYGRDIKDRSTARSEWQQASAIARLGGSVFLGSSASIHQHG
ncbi:hypothetical protein LshimejAT787_0506420 [Lyophyllum shimeji]|uniref:Uncharacterized protein n=1 Tax=Lyophyllum shimeji TaxID=47721 RepID=A0A9P3PNZ8_LYOSH|nr:hypothetical protein LshimejAT787_0506420 [Lyophyllum shimeji]